MRCAVAHVRVRAKSILESVRDVRACSPFMGVRCAIALLYHFAHFLGQNCQKMQLFVLKTILELECPIPFYNILSCFGTSFPVLDHLILF